MDAQEIAVDSTPIVAAERKDSLDSFFQKRPTRDDLVEKNILPSSTVHPALQAHQLELQKAMLADSLQHKIEHRPSPATLVESGMLPNDPRAI